MDVTVESISDVKVDSDDVLDQMETEDIIEYLKDNRVVIVVDENLLQQDKLKQAFEDICSLRTSRYLDRKTVKEVINEMIDDVFFS